MHKHLLTLCLFALLSTIAHAQQTAPATNIRLSTDSVQRKVLIQYDLPSIQPGDSVYIVLETVSGGTIRPRTITGDVGKSLKPGKNKKVYWDAVRDNVRLEEDVQVVIGVVKAAPVAPPVQPAVIEKPKPTTAVAQKTHPAVKPDMVVPRKGSILPIIGWAATGGLAIYSFALSSSINKDVDTYNAGVKSQNGVKYAETTAEWQRLNNLKSSVDSRKGTFTIVAGATVALAVANVVYLIVRKTKQPKTTLLVQPGNQVSSIGLLRKF